MKKALVLTLLSTAVALLALPSAGAAALPKWQVTLKPSPAQVKANQQVTYSGTVKTAAGKAAAGTVTIQKRLAPDGAWAAWRTAKLKANGSYSVTVKMTTPDRIWQMRARMPANKANAAAFSSSKKVVVAGSAKGATASLGDKVIELVNQERAKRGFASVSLHTGLTSAACAHSNEMAQREILTHVSANGASVAQRLIAHGYERNGYSSWSVGENIACASSGTLPATPEGVVPLWMDSPSHRQVILTAEFRDIGVGIATSKGGVRYYTLDMGRRIP